MGVVGFSKFKIFFFSFRELSEKQKREREREREDVETNDDSKQLKTYAVALKKMKEKLEKYKKL